jgi:hypothetical protein
MLIYHPAFDSHHSAFRQLVLLSQLPAATSTETQLRILDYYFLFPSELGNVTFPNDLRKEKKQWAQLKSRYNQIPDPRRVFDELKPYQEEGIRMLAATGVIKIEEVSGHLNISLVNIPESFLPVVNSATEEHSEILRLLAGEFSKIDLYGASGLKARTGLFEYRYDPT